MFFKQFVAVAFCFAILSSCKFVIPIHKEVHYDINEITRTDVIYADKVLTASAATVWTKDLNLHKKDDLMLTIAANANKSLKPNSLVHNVVSKTIIGKLLLANNNSFFTKKVDNLWATVYSPPGNKKRPAIIFAHGGAYLDGSRNDDSVKVFCEQMARRGYVTIAIDYRKMNLLTPSWLKAGYVAMQDFDQALRYFYTHADEFHIDKSKIVVGGISAGAISALHTALLDDYDEIEHRRYKLENMYGVIGYSGEAKPEEVWAVINISGAVFDKGIIDEDLIMMNFHGSEDNIISEFCELPFTQFSEIYNNVLEYVISTLTNYPKFVKTLEEMKAFNICGSDEITNEARRKGFKQIYKSSFEGEGHYLFANETGNLQRAGEEIINQIADVLYENY